MKQKNEYCFNLKIEDCWTACTRIKADKGHLLNKSTEWNNAYQEGFEACFEWLQNYRSKELKRVI